MLSKLLKTILATILMACSGTSLQTKAWHTSPSSDSMSSTVYPLVEWTAIEKLRIGMTVADAELLVHKLNSYHHPVNAIVFTRYDGCGLEVALKLSTDRRTIEDISFKILSQAGEGEAAGK